MADSTRLQKRHDKLKAQVARFRAEVDAYATSVGQVPKLTMTSYTNAVGALAAFESLHPEFTI